MLIMFPRKKIEDGGGAKPDRLESVLHHFTTFGLQSFGF